MIHNQAESNNLLHNSYNQNYIKVIPTDPHSIYTYWEITIGTKMKFQSVFGKNIWEQSKLVIKVNNLSTANCYFTNIEHDMYGCYININQPASIINTEIGMLVSEEFFISFAASNTVEMPNNSIIKCDTIHFTNIKDSNKIKTEIETDLIYEKFNFNNVFKILGPSSVEYPKYTDDIGNKPDSSDKNHR